MTVADAQLLERGTSDHDELAVENDDTTRGSSELGEKSRHLAWRHRLVCRQTSALMRGALRDNNDPVSHLVFSPTKPSVIAAYTEEYSRLAVGA